MDSFHGKSRDKKNSEARGFSGVPTSSKHRMALGILALTMCLAMPRIAAAQNQPNQGQSARDQSAQDQSNQASDPNAQPGSAEESQPPADIAPDQATPQGRYAPRAARNAPVPDTLTLPSGAIIPVRIQQWLSSDQNHEGDIFNAVLDQPLIANGWVVGRRGQTVTGRVVVAQKASHGKSESKLGVELIGITAVDGQQLPISTQLVQDSRTRSQGRDVATVSGTTALGAIIGGAVGGGSGAAIGAAAGIGAGIAAVMSTPGRPTVIRPEDLLTFQLQAPVDITTSQSKVAFRPVSQGDYGRDQDAYANRPRLRYNGSQYGSPYGQPYAQGVPYGPYLPGPYYYGCAGPWSCYPGAYYGPGFYGGVVFGPRTFGGRGRFYR